MTRCIKTNDITILFTDVKVVKIFSLNKIYAFYHPIFIWENDASEYIQKKDQ